MCKKSRGELGKVRKVIPENTLPIEPVGRGNWITITKWGKVRKVKRMKWRNPYCAQSSRLCYLFGFNKAWKIKEILEKYWKLGKFSLKILQNNWSKNVFMLSKLKLVSSYCCGVRSFRYSLFCKDTFIIKREEGKYSGLLCT